jgi:hypothetical protein
MLQLDNAKVMVQLDNARTTITNGGCRLSLQLSNNSNIAQQR